jgi:hypothetical protein
MAELDTFERRLAAAIVADADRATPHFDPAGVSRAAIARARRRRGRPGLVFDRVPRPRLAVTMAAVLAISLLVWEAGLRGLWVAGPSAPPEPSPTQLTTTPVATPRGSWTHAGSMATAQSDGVVAIVLLDGRVLVTGGAPDLRSSELYDPDSQTWSATGRTLEPRLSPTATLLHDGRVLLTGGLSDRTPPPKGDRITLAPVLASVEVYDPNTQTWARAAPMSSARAGHTATVMPDGRVLVTGGLAPGAALYQRRSSTEIYDPSSGSWTEGPAMHQARDSHTATLLPNGKLLVAGGHDGGRLGSAELYDPALGAWVDAAPLPEAFLGHSATLLPNGTLLISGGDVPTGPGAVGSAHAAIYDPGRDSWAMAASMVTARIGQAAVVLADRRVFVTGGGALGYPDPNPFSSAEIYDVATGVWMEAAPMNTPRTGHAAVLLPNGAVLVIGGSTSGGTSLASAELFEP